MLLAVFGLALAVAMSIGAASWLGARSVDTSQGAPADFEAAAGACMDAVNSQFGGGLVPSSVSITVGDHALIVHGVTSSDVERPVTCSVTWSPGFADHAVELSVPALAT